MTALGVPAPAIVDSLSALPANSKAGGPLGAINTVRRYAPCPLCFDFRQNSLAYRAVKAQPSRATADT